MRKELGGIAIVLALVVGACGDITTQAITGVGGRAGTAGALGDRQETGGSGSVGGAIEAGGRDGATGGAVASTGGAAASGGTGGQSAGPPNLVANGDFADGTTGWQITADGASLPATVAGGELCVALQGGASVAVIGWPVAPAQPTALVAGNIYRLSFGVRSNVRMDASQFEDKIGQTITPFVADFDMGDAVAPGAQTVAHTFTLAKDDLTAGVVFLLHGPPAGTMFCVDNVRLQQVVLP